MTAAAAETAPAPYYADEQVTLHLGKCLDVLRAMRAASVDAVVTSPPYYGLRDYGHEEQWGNEKTVGEYVERMRALFAELRRVLTPAGAVWLNLGDTYAGKANASTGAGSRDRDRPERQIAQLNRLADAPYKSLIGVPWRVALALQDDGWAVRNELIWAKTNPMPHPVEDRLNAAHETVFLLTPRPRYYFDLTPVREQLKYPDKADGSITFGGRKVADRDDGTASSRMTSAYGAKHTERTAERGYRPATGARHTGGNPAGRNPGAVWSLATQPCAEAHFAVMPEELARRLVLTVCPEGGTVLDPFNGRGTTGRVARLHGRRYVGIDLKPDYLDLTVAGIAQGVLL